MQSSDALLSQSDYWRADPVGSRLASDRDSPYHQPVSEFDLLQPSPKIIAIVGPTGSGKSELGIEVALRLNGEVINCDSVQVYQGIQIATAKVPLTERRGVPHHLIDFVPPARTFTAVDWAREATEIIQKIESRQRIPILVGGTGFYLRALRQPFFPSPTTNQDLRERLSDMRDRRGPEHLHRILQRLDRPEAEQLSPRDWPRVQRAIEFRLQTGERISAQRPIRPEPPELARRIRVIALNPPREELYARINVRTEKHFSDGLVDEVQRLLKEGVPSRSSALGAHGYRRVVECLEGRRDLCSAIEQTKLDVRHYAKRQVTWFRREPGIEWIDGFGDDATIQLEVFQLLKSENIAPT